jgi:hypothetical protein
MYLQSIPDVILAHTIFLAVDTDAPVFDKNEIRFLLPMPFIKAQSVLL